MVSNMKLEEYCEFLVKEEDMGSVIGHSGRNAQALRTLIQAFAYINNLGHVKLNIDSF